MIRRIRRTSPWFGAVAAHDIEPETYVEDEVATEPEPEPEVEAEVEVEEEPEAAAESNRNIEKFFDLLLVRPLYLARLVVGVPFMVVYPLTLGSGYAEDVVALLWTDPYEATFKRSLGEAPGDY